MENLHQLIDSTLSKKVTRKEFLQYAGLGLLTVVGLGGILKNLKLLDNKRPLPVSNGYGTSAYGGSKR